MKIDEIISLSPGRYKTLNKGLVELNKMMNAKNKRR